MFILKDNIAGTQFTGFINLCFSNATYFSLTHNGYKEFATSNEHADVLEALKPYLIQERSTTHWHCHYVPESHAIKVNIYRVCESSMSTLLKYYDNLFCMPDASESGATISHYPEDLCFFKDNLLLLGTVSHEGICYLYSTDESLTQTFHNFGTWHKIEPLEKEQIQLLL